VAACQKVRNLTERSEAESLMSRFLGEEGARLSFADAELDNLAVALDVPIDLLSD
jgi:hypothetical protein